MFNDTKKLLISSQITKEFEYQKWIEEIPFFSLPEDFMIQVIPPFNGAVVRFRIAHKNSPNKYISVYLDCYDLLGIFGEPYWEAYPIGEDVHRVPLKDINELIEIIINELKK